MKSKKTTTPAKSNPLKKNMLSGLGLVSMTTTKIDEMAKSLVKGRDDSAEEGDKVAKQILQQVEKSKKQLEKRVKDLVQEATEKMRGPSMADFLRLEGKVAKLQKTLSGIESKLGVSPNVKKS